MANDNYRTFHADIRHVPLLLVDRNGDEACHALDSLERAGWQDPIRLQSLEELPARVHAVRGVPEPQPCLAVIAAGAIDPQLLDQLRQLQRLTSAGSLGIVVMVTSDIPSPETEQALAHGCLDVLPLRAGDVPARLRLAGQLLCERHRRIAREQRLKEQLAKRRVMEARLNYVATHDVLTDLANRRAMEEALDTAIRAGRESGITHALLYLDLDRFKLHNDAAGHRTGDRLLRTIGNLLRGTLPAEYPVARLGSDEFAVFIPGADEREATTTAERVRAVVEAIEPGDGLAVYHVSASIGLAMLEPGSVSGPTQALAQAEQACYFAKTRGGNAVHRFSRSDEALQQLHEDMYWAAPLRRALAEDRFFLAYQPVLSVRENRVSHFEALIRLPTGIGKGDGTASFMPAAERLGLARQIDLWTVNRAVDFLAEHSTFSLGVNLSSHAFQEQALLPLLREKLESTAISPGRLVFEITETAAVLNFTETRRMIGELRSLGCRFAIDDFGSGFSSYNYIKQFPVDMVKIDGSFVVDMRKDRRDRAIVQSMIDIAHNLDKEVVAEFIEDRETLRLLVTMGIDYGQGYYIGRPTRDPVLPDEDRMQ